VHITLSDGSGIINNHYNITDMKQQIVDETQH